jgi:hypothetical protein
LEKSKNNILIMGARSHVGQRYRKFLEGNLIELLDPNYKICPETQKKIIGLIIENPEAAHEFAKQKWFTSSIWR